MGFILGWLQSHTAIWHCRARRVSDPRSLSLRLCRRYVRQGRSRHREGITFGLHSVRQADSYARERRQQAVLYHCCASVCIPGREHRARAEPRTIRRRLRPILYVSPPSASPHPILIALVKKTDNNDCGLDQPQVLIFFSWRHVLIVIFFFLGL